MNPVGVSELLLWLDLWFISNTLVWQEYNETFLGKKKTLSHQRMCRWLRNSWAQCLSCVKMVNFPQPFHISFQKNRRETTRCRWPRSVQHMYFALTCNWTERSRSPCTMGLNLSMARHSPAVVMASRTFSKLNENMKCMSEQLGEKMKTYISFKKGFWPWALSYSTVSKVPLSIWPEWMSFPTKRDWHCDDNLKLRKCIMNWIINSF